MNFDEFAMQHRYRSRLFCAERGPLLTNDVNAFQYILRWPFKMPGNKCGSARPNNFTFKSSHIVHVGQRVSGVLLLIQ